MAEPQIVFSPLASHAEREYVEEIVNRRNVRLTGQDDWYPVNFFVKTEEGEILGGLLGYIWARWLYISILAIKEPFRGKGYGTELMRRAEEYALARGCTNAWLSTFSFQARPLYERLGYMMFGKLDDYPQGHSLFFMTKHLTASD
jgi:GNAT superfamily N-acetyltransferase